VSEAATDGASAALPNSVEPNRAARRRESALLIVLALVGATLEYPLALAIKSIELPELVHTMPFLLITVVLASMVPFALRVNPRLGLPGAPLIAAMIAGEPMPLSIRSLLKISIGYAILAAAAGAAVLGVLILPMLIIAHPHGGSLNLPVPPMLKLAPGRIALVGALVAIAAAVSEEIQFRLVLFAVFTWIARLVSRDLDGRPGRGALWFATILQAYAFGLVHLLPLAGSMFHSTGIFLVGGLLMPQTWEGVVFGRLYLKRGLEAAMLAHATMDVAMFVLAAIGVLGSQLGAK